MSLAPSRLRAPEWLAAAGAVVMLVALFALDWYGPATGAPTTRTGWTATHLHWLVLIAILLGLALALTQAACRGPALPASLSVISSVVAFITLLWLVYRVVLDTPPHQEAGAWIELCGALALFVGSYWSIRLEGIRPQDGPQEIPVVRLPPAEHA